MLQSLSNIKDVLMAKTTTPGLILCVRGFADIVCRICYRFWAQTWKMRKWGSTRFNNCLALWEKVCITESFSSSPIYLWSLLAILLKGLIMPKICGIYEHKSTTLLISLSSTNSLYSFITCDRKYTSLLRNSSLRRITFGINFFYVSQNWLTWQCEEVYSLSWWYAFNSISAFY